MAHIHVLSQDLINQIAAGEVIERPASVVKELVENALDAGATEITVEVEDGGIGLIRVADNGRGIAEDEVETAILRHATSKITATEDLFAIRTLGFRGEALPSILSVSRTSVTTRPATASHGLSLTLEGGAVLQRARKGMPEGTVIEVRDLFYNTPARKKFLKTTATEQRNIIDVISRYALARPDVRFTVSMNGRTVLNLLGGADLIQRGQDVLGRSFKEKLYPFHRERPGITLSGLLALPDLSRPTRAGIYPFVNGRAVKDSTLTAAVIEGYSGLLMTRRYPVAILFVEVDPAEVDVNVHPAKAEVRFRYPSAVFGAIVKTVRDFFTVSEQPEILPEASEAVLRDKLVPRYELSGPRDAGTAEPPVSVHSGETAPLPRPEFSPAHLPLRPLTSSAPPTSPQAEAPSQEQLFRPALQDSYARLAFIGTLQDTYILLADNEALYILDQHAAHERINYERLKAASSDEHPQTQMLMHPLVIELTAQEYAAFAEIGEDLRAVGIDADDFGEGAVAVRAVPALLKDSNIRNIIMDLIHGVLEGRLNKNDYRADLLATVACHRSIRAHRALAPREIEILLRDLDAAGAPQTCPHGRPLYKKISIIEIEKWIGRRP